MKRTEELILTSGWSVSKQNMSWIKRKIIVESYKLIAGDHQTGSQMRYLFGSRAKSKSRPIPTEIANSLAVEVNLGICWHQGWYWFVIISIQITCPCVCLFKLSIQVSTCDREGGRWGDNDFWNHRCKDNLYITSKHQSIAKVVD